MTTGRTIAAFIVICTALVAGIAAPAQAENTWAPEAEATVHPGVTTYTDGAQCTANFVFTQGTSVYLGQAAHCSGTGAATDTDGCTSASLPLGTPVTVTGATKPGVMVYNSWIAMQKAGERDPETCAYNDFALIRLDPADAARTNPTVPKWGGPTAVGGAAVGESVYSYGNSSLRFGVAVLSPKQGTVVEASPGGWSHTVYTVTPGIPGDSGSAFLNAKGEALGILSTLAFAPLPGSNGVGTLRPELAYARGHGFPDLALAAGTRPFSAGL
ncbi:MAG: serine protease [Streptomycetaceae bacterium]|nr:serine protease [Streptomycetaceae bacterium]